MIMNRITIYLTLAAALLALAGCNKEPVADGGAITVDATLGAATKVSADGDAFTSGDQIAVYAWLGGATQMPDTRVVDGVVNTFDGTKWTPASMMRWQVTDDPHYFLGVSPVPTAAITDFTAVPYTLDPTKYVESDLLLATTPDGVKNTGAAVPLAFHHAMAKLTVNLKFRSQWATTPDVSAVTVTAKSMASVNYLTQAVTATGTASAVTVPEVTSIASGYDRSFSGLQVPQTGVRKVTVTIDGKNYVYEAGEDITLAAGRNTTLNLIVGRDKIDLSGISLSPWTAEDPLSVGDAELDMLTTPLTFEAKVAGASIDFHNYSYTSRMLCYRTYDGTVWSDWAEFGIGDSVELAKVGDKVQFMGDNSGMGNCNFLATRDCYLYGNIMSLITSTDFSTCTTLTENGAFSGLFMQNDHIVSHPTLELLLPATTLTAYCYSDMFNSTSLTSPPKLPATTLAKNCYNSMFSHSHLAEVPELPAMSLEEYCYANMFSYCKSLTIVPVNLLPATELAGHCYDSMFDQCSNLTAAPVLPAQTLPEFCYFCMFYDCSKLSSVTCLATDISASGCVDCWLYDAGSSVTGTKTFVTPSTTPWIMGNEFEGIPTGWTRVDY